MARSTERRRVVLRTLGPGNSERDRDIANAALRFKRADVDRVLFVRGSYLAARFMRAADDNRYRPRYGLTSDGLWTDGVAPEQLAGARGIGWMPDPDLRPRAPDTWSARDACLAFFNDRGLPTGTYDERAMALWTCWTRFGPDRRDGAAAYHDVAYDRDCGCFVYTGGPHPLP